jgi:hypothetical protein
MKQMDEAEVITPENAQSITVEFEHDPTECELITVNGTEILRPKRGAKKQCTISDILEAIGGDIIPQTDPMAQSTYGDCSRLAKKLGVALSTVYEWRKKYPIVDQAMIQESERDLDFIENICRSHMIAGDSRATVKWLEAKGRSRGWGRDMTSSHIKQDNTDSELNDMLKHQSPRDRLKGIARLVQEGRYDPSVKQIETNR